jgi:hypothetical protein
MNLSHVSDNVTDFFAARRKQMREEPTQAERDLAMSGVIVACCNRLRLRASDRLKVMKLARELRENGVSIAVATQRAKDTAQVIAYERDGDGPRAA